MSTAIQWDEYDGEVIDGIRYANTFTANMAKNSRIIGAELEQERIIKLLEEERKRHKEEGLLTAAVYIKDLIALIKGEGDNK